MKPAGGPPGTSTPDAGAADGAVWRVDVAWLHDGQCHEATLTLDRDPRAEPPLTFGALLDDPRVRARVPAALIERRFGLAVFGQRRRLDDVVEPGDRVEIVPPLHADPKDSRRQRVEARRRGQRRDRWHTA